MIYFAFIVVFIICLFILYVLAKNDFVLLRKNISLSQVFDTAFVATFLSFFLSRLFFILDSFSFQLFHPIRFLYIFKLPGLSYLGFTLGMALVLYLYFRQKKSMLRIYDIYSLAFYPLLLFMILRVWFSGVFFIVQLLFLIIYGVLFFILLRFHKNFTINDGSVAIIILAAVAGYNLFLYSLITKHTLFFSFSFSQYVSMGILLLCFVLLLINQKIIFKKLKK